MVKNMGLLMEMLAIVYGIAAFFGKKVKYDIKTVSFIMSEILLTTLINEYNLPSYLFSLSYLIIFVYGLGEYEEGIKGTILNFLLLSGTMIVLQQVLYYTVFLFLPNNNAMQNILFINAGCFFTFWIFMHYRMLNLFYKGILNNSKIFVGLLLFVCTCLLVNILKAKGTRYLMDKDSLQILYFTGLMLVVVFEWQRTKIRTEKRRAEMELNSLYSSAYEELIMLIRDRQHDIKNHINTIYSMIYTTDTYEELVERQKKYCDFVLESGRETQLLLAVDNPLISGFLFQKVQEIKSHNIQAEYRLETIRFPLAATEYEIIELLGILVDNAIEALITSNLERRKVLIGYKREEQWDIFYVSNTSRFYSEEEIQKFFQRNYSSKGKGRGIGLDKVRRKLKQLDGGIKVECKVYDEEQHLEFSMMLPVILK